MGFLGLEQDSWEACPRLKDADLPGERMYDLYIEFLGVLRRMYKVCRLVHADLSEYNIIYNPNDEHLYTFDVSQSVEHDHPHAFDFLRSDINNMDEFFARRGIATLGIKRTFDFTIESWGKNGEEDEDEIRAEVERRLELTAPAEDGENDDEDGTQADAAREKQEQDDQVFKQSYIPRTLNEVYDVERDVQRVAQGEREQLIYANIAEVVGAKKASATPTAEAEPVPAVVRLRTVHDADLTQVAEDGNGNGDDSKSSGSEEDDSEQGSDEESEYGSDDSRVKVLRGKKHEDKDAKKERKAAVKEEKREKRKDKIPKSVKKAKMKKSSGKKK